MCGAPVTAHSILGRRLNSSQGLSPKKKIGIATSICRCDNCGLIFTNPLPIPEDINDHYGVPPEYYWTPSYFKVDDSYFKGEIEQLKKLIDFKIGMRSLDIGAGIGKQMKVLQKEGFDTYGIEPSSTFRDKGIEHSNIDPSRILHTSIEDAEFDSGMFDFVSFGAVLEHLYNPSEAIAKSMDWLKPGGIVHIEVPSSKWLVGKLLNAYYKITASDFVSNLSPMHEPFHLYEFGLDSFNKNGVKHGYEIAHHEFYVCTTTLPSMFDKILKPIMRHTDTGMQLCIWLRKKDNLLNL